MGSVDADAFADTVRGAPPEVGLRVSAAAGAPTVTVCVVDAALPALSVAVTFIEYWPPNV